MKTAIAVLLTILATTSLLSAQPCFERWFGGSDTDYCFGATRTLDGGYLVYGYTTSYGSATSSVWLVRTDAHGDTLWTRTHGASDVNCATSVLRAEDSGFVVAGYTSASGAGANDFLLMRVDANGDSVWAHTYGGAAEDNAYSLAQTDDGGYILVGSTESFGSGDKDVWLVRTDADGDTMWTRVYGDTARDDAAAVVQTPDGGFAVIGYRGGTSDDAAWLIRTDADGDTTWTHTYGGQERSDYGFALEMTPDHGFIFAGRTYTYGGAFGDLWLVRTDSLGDTLWTRAYGGSDFDDGQSVRLTSDSGFVVTGGTKSFGAGEHDAWLIKTDANGDSIWSRTFGGSQVEYGVTVAQTPDGGFIVGGYTTSFGAGTYDFYAIKTDPDGYVGVVEPDRPVAHRVVPAATVISRAQLLSEMAGPGQVLFDASGRAVREPAGISPGVYFLGRETAGKVLVTR